MLIISEGRHLQPSNYTATISINQSNFYSANIPSKARLSGTTDESVFNNKISETVQWHQRAVGCAGVYREGQVKEMCLDMFLEGSN